MTGRNSNRDFRAVPGAASRQPATSLYAQCGATFADGAAAPELVEKPVQRDRDLL
jgi:hypothetical protein